MTKRRIVTVGVSALLALGIAAWYGSAVARNDAKAGQAGFEGWKYPGAKEHASGQGAGGHHAVLTTADDLDKVVAFYEKKTGVLLSGDIVYDGPLIDDAYHSDVGDYLATLERMRRLAVSVVHGGHFPSFGPTRLRQLIDEYLAGKRKPGCHL